MSIGTLGPVVGPVAGLPAGSTSSLTDDGAGYDFAIGGQGFHIAPNDESPYERATAQFRKEQLDTSQNYGDQSLLGYWTRGQFSFHLGAGVKYYELADGEDVLNRYAESEGVDPFEPGEVSLHPSWQAATPDTYANVIDVGAISSTELAVLQGGKVTYGALGVAGSTYAPSSAVLAAATGGGNIYCALSNKTISRIGLSFTYPELYNYGFEAGLDSWFSSTGVSSHEVATVAVSAVGPFEGSNSLLATWPATGATDQSFVVRGFTGLTIGRAYTMVANVKLSAGTGGNIRPTCLFSSSGTAIATEGAWVENSFTFVATSVSHFVGYENTNLAAAGPTLNVDKVRLYEGSRVGYDTGAVPTDVIYTHSKGIRELFYAKDRLFMMDEAGTWHQLAPNPTAALPVAIAGGDVMFTATTDGRWTVADTPGPVLFGNTSRIFAVTQDSSNGAFPTLTAPVQVADLPVGEDVLALSGYLGFLAIVTTLGVRIGIVADSGSVTYGPRLVEWDDPPGRTTIGRRGEGVFVAADSRVIEVNLGAQIGQTLEFGWADLPNPFDGAEANYGVMNVGTTLVAWGDDFVSKQSTTPTASGTLTTGYHRFSTLELKKFQSVRVRVGGTGGSVAVAKVTASGAVVPLYTLQVGASTGEDITLAMDDPAEMVALKFTLTPSGANSPILLGYQIRALPAPRRQRLIRIPLLLQDVERNGTTRAKGRTGSAWERLSALEEMEMTGGTFTFQDFRTGESGQCFIESVEHKGTTPPARQSTGYGGKVFLTIRKL
jgi:hypothetical protein